MKILIITPYIPYPLDSGGNQAFFTMVDYLKDIHDISLILPVNARSYINYRKLSELWKDKVIIYPYNGKGHTGTEIYNHGFYLKAISYLNASFGRKIKRWINRHMSDIVDNPDMFRYHSALFYDLPQFSEGFMQFIYDTSRKEKFDCIQVEFYSHFPFRMLLLPMRWPSSTR